MRPVAIVTGATGGIGLHVAIGLAGAGLHTVLVGRSPQRLADARAHVEREIPAASLETARADLALLRETADLGRRLIDSHPAIAILVNNAGVFATERSVTTEGRERVLATNHLAPFALTAALLPSLAAAGGGRIVNVGSVMADRARIDPRDLELERGWRAVRAYGASKLALTMATLDWAERLQPRSVAAHVVHPGSVATGIVRDGRLARLGWTAMRPFLLSAEQGAASVLHAALSPALDGRTGLYWHRQRAARPNPLALDASLRNRVWQETERLTGLRA